MLVVEDRLKTGLESRQLLSSWSAVSLSMGSSLPYLSPNCLSPPHSQAQVKAIVPTLSCHHCLPGISQLPLCQFV